MPYIIAHENTCRLNALSVKVLTRTIICNFTLRSDLFVIFYNIQPRRYQRPFSSFLVRYAVTYMSSFQCSTILFHIRILLVEEIPRGNASDGPSWLHCCIIANILCWINIVGCSLAGHQRMGPEFWRLGNQVAWPRVSPTIFLALTHLHDAFHNTIMQQ